MKQRFSNVINKSAIDLAFALRSVLLSEDGISHLASEHWLMAMESSVSNTLSGPENFEPYHGWKNRHRLSNIDGIMEARLDSQLVVSELAGEFGTSGGFFSREFKSALGRSPHLYIIDKCLAAVRMELHQSK